MSADNTDEVNIPYVNVFNEESTSNNTAPEMVEPSSPSININTPSNSISTNNSSASTNSTASTVSTVSTASTTQSEVSESSNSTSSNVSQEEDTIDLSPINTQFEGITNAELENMWDTESNFEMRDRILKELQRRNLFPSNALGKWEYETGAYPDNRDPEFLQKLLAKREFAESLQTTWKPRTNPCEDDSSFEVTPVQRFVANFMSPKTPYMSALLFHGVGVGKTCAGVQIIEAWLEQFPRSEVYLIAPPTIQQGFFRTIFDISKVIIGEGNEPNSASQCTGVT